MANDTSTLNGSLQQLGETMATNLTTKGVTASPSDGLTTLAGKILSIQIGGSSGGITNVATGTFTTGSTGGSTGTVTLNYNGTGYPLAAFVFVTTGLSDTSTSWYTDVARYDVGLVAMVKAVTSTTPTYATSGSQNYGAISYLYKSSTSNATSYSRTGSQTANTYTSSSTNASTGSSMIRFKGNGKTLSYYVGNRSSSTYGLARSTTFQYIVIYSS